MFAGHAALAFASRRPARDLSLGVLVAASFGLDLLWPIFLLLGVEQVAVDPGNTAFTALDFQSYPWTHSLLLSTCWAVAAGAVTWGICRRTTSALIVSALVVSHWLLDFLTHRPDLPLWPGNSAPMAGLGLWNSIVGTFLVEGSLFAGSIWLYARTTRPRDRAGSIGMWSFVGLVGVIWTSGPFSPPPPSADAVTGVALAIWLLPPWAWWFDRHREPRSQE